MREKIISNKAECRECRDVIESKSVHDYRSCKCGAIFVDGGREYLRRGGKSLDLIKDLSETIQQPANEWLGEELAKTLLGAGLGGRYEHQFKSKLKTSLRWGLVSELKREISTALDLNLDQYQKLERVLIKELVGE